MQQKQPISKIQTDTYHEVKTETGQPRTIYSWEDEAAEFEFYFPVAIWPNSLVADFVRKFSSVPTPDGATIFENTVGLWRGTMENTHVVRIVVRQEQLDRVGLRHTALNIINRLTANLSRSAETKQTSIIFTDKAVVVSTSSLEQPQVRVQEHPKRVTPKHIV